jgi:hypothetical protein
MTIAVELAHHQPRVFNLTDTHHGIKTLLDHVDQPITELQLQLHLGIGLLKRNQVRHQPHPQLWQTEAQLPLRFTGSLGELPLGHFVLGKNSMAAFQKQTALRRQGDGARGPVKQPSSSRATALPTADEDTPVLRPASVKLRVCAA